MKCHGLDYICVGSGGGGGGGGGALDLHFGRYVPRRSEKYGARERLERENDGLWSGLQCVELVVSGPGLL